MPSSKNSQQIVSVSNGLELFLVPLSELADAESHGYYRPESRGLTIVEKSGRIYEVPLGSADLAVRNGYRDVLARERRKPTSPQAVIGSSGDGLPNRSSGPNIRPIDANLKAPQKAKVSVDADLIAAAIERSNQLAEQLRIEQEEQIKAAVGWRQHWLRFRFWIFALFGRLQNQFGATSVSVLIHVAMILVFASYYLVQAETKPPFVVVASPSLSDSLVDEFTMELQELEITEPTDKEVADASPVKEIVPEITNTVSNPDFLSALSGQAIQMPAGAPKAAPIPGEGLGDSKGKPTVFGSKFAAINYVFVIDNSNSMTKGRFETALIQLMLTINQLTPKQRFYVIFYSDTAYGMMHPNTVPNLVPATPQNKQLLGKWLNTVPLCLQTNGRKAIQAAIDLKPDIIFVLGDGAFTDKAAQHFASQPHPSIVIHTLGMEVKEADAKQFQLLATSHRGTYRDVGVMPEGAAMAQKFPRPRNSERGSVWGITLKSDK